MKITKNSQNSPREFLCGLCERNWPENSSFEEERCWSTEGEEEEFSEGVEETKAVLTPASQESGKTTQTRF